VEGQYLPLFGRQSSHQSGGGFAIDAVQQHRFQTWVRIGSIPDRSLLTALPRSRSAPPSLGRRTATSIVHVLHPVRMRIVRI
jgi:hypothetical protein